LAANITAGHLLFAILSSFIWTMMTSISFLSFVGLFPLAIALFITILEIAVALIQAYVFCLLTTIYLNDSVHLH
jgi:F0F1-type ATP synthase membrane subunit a